MYYSRSECFDLSFMLSFVVVYVFVGLLVCSLVNFSLDSGGNNRWIKFNANMTGVYRVHYSDANWQALITQLKHDHSVSNLNVSAYIYSCYYFYICQ